MLINRLLKNSQNNETCKFSHCIVHLSWMQPLIGKNMQRTGVTPLNVPFKSSDGLNDPLKRLIKHCY